MRIVAGGAGEGFGIRPVAGGFEETVGGGGELELVVIARVGFVVEVEGVVGERFAGAVREDVAVVAEDLAGEREVGGFEVALEADLNTAGWREAGGVDDGGSGGVGGVVAAGAVATLAIDAYG